MTQHAKKSAHPASNHKKSSFQPLAAVKKIEENVLEMEREGLENAVQMTGSINKAASECVAACSNNLSACIESSNHTSHALQNIGTEVMQCCNRAFSDLTEISKEAAGCRSLHDVVELQNRMVQQASDNYFTTVNKLSGMLFDYFSRAVRPFGTRMASTTKHLRRAFAA